MSDVPSSREVVAAVRRRPGATTRQLARRLGLEAERLPALAGVLRDLERQGELLQVPGSGWNVPAATPYRTGFLRIDRRGRASLLAPRRRDETVRLQDAGGALSGDLVLVRLARPRGRVPRGKVVQILERRRRLVRGRYWKARHGGVVQPEGRELTEIAVPRGKEHGAADGAEVLVRLDERARDGRPRGEVTLLLEDEGSVRIDLEVVCAEFGLPGEHTPEADEAAARFEEPAGAHALRGRVDLRELPVFTIDPEEAQDFDDAISLESLPGGAVRLGVHIADVSHYVRPGSLLDAVARERATSVYLPGRVIPMLPHRLSDDLSSLRPGEDRLTKTVFLTFSRRGNLRESQILRSVIRSHRRFTYEEVAALLEEGPEDGEGAGLPGGAGAFRLVLRRMARLRDRLREVRLGRGGLSLDLRQLKVEVSDGRVTAVRPCEATGAHRLIEEFMLAANEAVARHLLEQDLPILSRFHAPPDEEKLAELRVFLRSLGFRPPGGSSARDLGELVELVSSSPLAEVCQLALLRSLEHAEYVAGQAAHFALAADAYCHFTSPIRRYPDLLIHQVLDDHLAGRLRSERRRREWQREVEAVAEHVSSAERRAEEAERAMTQLCLVRFLEPRLGEEFPGVVSTVHEFGFFVRLEELPVEGLVHVATLGDDFFQFDPAAYRLKGRQSRREFRPGQRVRVELSGVDADSRRITLRVIHGE